MFLKTNLYPYPFEIKEWIAANIGWGGMFTVTRDGSSYTLGSVSGKGKKHAPGSIPTNAAQALVNAAQASFGPTSGGGKAYIEHPAVTDVTFDLVEPTFPGNMAPQPIYYAPNEKGKAQYLADLGKHLAATRKPHDDELALGRAPDLRYFSK